jgi:hypothetical protein
MSLQLHQLRAQARDRPSAEPQTTRGVTTLSVTPLSRADVASQLGRLPAIRESQMARLFSDRALGTK